MLDVTDVVVTGAGTMKPEYIFHAVGPKFQENDYANKLRVTIQNVLQEADVRGVKRIAFPPMGTGFYGVPLDLCAEIMKDTIGKHLEGNTSIEEAVISVIDKREYLPFKAHFDPVTTEQEN